MDHDPPIPKPRPSPGLPGRDLSVKKPIPLPRFKNLMRRESGDRTNTQQHDYDNTENKEGGSPKQSVTQMLKDEFKSASDNVQERGKLVMESTRRLARNMIPKRFTAQQEYNGKDNPLVSGVIAGRCHSLPSDDIFQSISFNSPLTSPTTKVNEFEVDETNSQELDEEEDEKSDSPVEDHPPPLYPPPPPPDETVYDEVSSMKSGYSGSQQDTYYCSSETDSCRDIDGIYEELSNTRTRNSALGGDGDSHSTSLSMFQCSDSESLVLPPPDRRAPNVLRSDSWTFYDSAHCTSGEGTEVTVSPNNIYNEDPVSRTSASWKTGSSSPSISSELDLLTVNCMDDIPSSVNCSSSSETASSCMSSHSTSSGSNSVPIKVYGDGGVEMRLKPQHSLHKLPSKSVIYEFDPLYENVPTAESLAQSRLSDNDLMILAGLVPAKSAKTSNYGKVSVKQREVSGKTGLPSGGKVTVIEEEEPPPRPPVPPKRFDSITPASMEIDNETSAHEERAIDVSDDTVSIASSVQSITSSSAQPSQDQDPVTGRFALIRQHWPSMKKAIKLGSRRESKVLPSEIDSHPEKSAASAFYANLPPLTSQPEKPSLEPQLAVQYSGKVYRGNGGSGAPRELSPRWCHLAESQLSCTADKSGGGSKDVVSLESVLSVYLVMEQRVGSDGEALHCFEVSISGKGRSQLFGVTATMERRVWMQKILENFTTVFPLRIAAGYSRFGWCFFKEGIGGSWMSAWLLLHQRTLLYCPPKGAFSEADLRKARSIVIQEPDSVSPVILIDFPKSSLYLRMERPSETVAWRNAIRSAATDNRPELESQQLTQENVPVLVDKCINFVYAHGSLSEGIYRRSGGNSNVTKLLAMFRQDAWAVQLSRQDFSEYDVASVLKRFFRDLPEPLLTTQLHPLLCKVTCLENEDKRIQEYKHILEQLPPVNAVTVRRLLAHLHFIHEESEHNLMPVDNLAAIWGPTLMHIENCGGVSWSRQESKVIVDLVSMYPRLYAVDAEEVDRDHRIREVLQRLHAGRVHPQQAKPTGDLRVWVHIRSKDSGECVNVMIGPQKLCGEVCAELASHLSLHAHQVTLCEVVLGGALQRFLHHSERVLDTVLRWGYWDEPDRSQNCLILVPNLLFQELHVLTTPPVAMCGELRFADQKSKSFKTYPFEFSQAKLCYYKDKRGAVKLGEWPIEEVVWYQGYEPKRNPNSRWALTFISKNNKPKRCKESPYFGCTMAGTCKEDQNKWMAALLAGEYPQGLLPPPVQLNLLE